MVLVVHEKLLKSPSTDALTAVLLLDADLLEVGDDRILAELPTPDAGPLSDDFGFDLAVAVEQSRTEVGRFAFETERALSTVTSCRGRRAGIHQRECAINRVRGSPHLGVHVFRFGVERLFRVIVRVALIRVLLEADQAQLGHVDRSHSSLDLDR